MCSIEYERFDISTVFYACNFHEAFWSCSNGHCMNVVILDDLSFLPAHWIVPSTQNSHDALYAACCIGRPDRDKP